MIIVFLCTLKPFSFSRFMTRNGEYRPYTHPQPLLYLSLPPSYRTLRRSVSSFFSECYPDAGREIKCDVLSCQSSYGRLRHDDQHAGRRSCRQTLRHSDRQGQDAVSGKESNNFEAVIFSSIYSATHRIGTYCYYPPRSFYMRVIQWLFEHLRVMSAFILSSLENVGDYTEDEGYNRNSYCSRFAYTIISSIFKFYKFNLT